MAQCLPSVDFAHGDLTCGEQCPEQHGGGLGGRQNRLCLDAALELLMEPFDRIRGACALPLAERQPSEGEEPITGLLQAVSAGRYPYESLWKCGSTSGSRALLTTIWAMRSATVGIPSGRDRLALQPP